MAVTGDGVNNAPALTMADIGVAMGGSGSDAARDPKAAFMDRAMVASILASAVGLFAAVSAAYLLTWYRGADPLLAQTAAFAAWMIGHVLLAFNMRSEHQPILQLGLGSNRLMLAWGGAVIAFLLLVSPIPVARQLLKITTLAASQWVLILVATLLGTFWLELRMLITYRG